MALFLFASSAFLNASGLAFFLLASFSRFLLLSASFLNASKLIENSSSLIFFPHSIFLFKWILTFLTRILQIGHCIFPSTNLIQCVLWSFFIVNCRLFSLLIVDKLFWFSLMSELCLSFFFGVQFSFSFVRICFFCLLLSSFSDWSIVCFLLGSLSLSIACPL